MTRTILATAAATALFAGGASAQHTMADFDADGDGYIGAAELAAQAAADFESLDTDQSGGLSAGEVASAQISRFDTDDDQMLDRAEYDASRVGIDPLRTMGQESGGPGDSQYAADRVGIDALENMGRTDGQSGLAVEDEGGEDLAKFDSDGDAMLDHEEYMLSLEDAFGVFDVDKSGELSQQELGEAQVSRFDSDGDGMLSEDEYLTQPSTQSDG